MRHRVRGEGVRADVHVHRRRLIRARPHAPHRANHCLHEGKIRIPQNRRDHFRPHGAGHICEGAIRHHRPHPPIGGYHLPGIVTGGVTDMPHGAAHHRLNRPGHGLAGLPHRLNLDAIRQILKGYHLSLLSAHIGVHHSSLICDPLSSHPPAGAGSREGWEAVPPAAGFTATGGLGHGVWSSGGTVTWRMPTR
ncbi:MAG: hypothetical protein BWY76_01255 [bacterium ADurb.Bin429]|nr:MAG: hypothetical protein BWY76_01255 [bacterium ADurb.Bin429]